MSSIEISRRTCARTGLSLVGCNGEPLWRVARTSFGPLNPLVRNGQDQPLDRLDWGRWDVSKHRTVYGASCAAAAYAESIAALRIGLKESSDGGARLGDVFTDDGQDLRSLLDGVRQDWQDRGYMAPGQQAASWRAERYLYELRLPRSGWLVEISAADSVGALRAWFNESSEIPLVEELTVAHLMGEDRALTTTIAEWVWHQVLDDGSLPHGIRYHSKHGTDWYCIAVWLRQLDDGLGLGAEPTVPVGGRPIAVQDQDPDLRHVANLFDIRFH